MADSLSPEWLAAFNTQLDDISAEHPTVPLEARMLAAIEVTMFLQGDPIDPRPARGLLG